MTPFRDTTLCFSLFSEWFVLLYFQDARGKNYVQARLPVILAKCGGDWGSWKLKKKKTLQLKATGLYALNKSGRPVKR